MTLKITLATLSLAAAAGVAQASTYAIDPTHTAAIFEIDHFGTSTNRGRFAGKEGKVEFDRATKKGKVDLTIDLNSVYTGVASLDSHLKSKAVFNVNEYATARFLADQFVFSGDKVTEVSGTLTLLDKTQPVTLKANRFNCYTNPMLKREICGGDFETTIQRSQWGLTWGSNFGFPDTVRLLVQVEAIAQP